MTQLNDKTDKPYQSEFHIDQCHYKRRREILASHPEIRTYMFLIDPHFKFVSAITAITHIYFAYLFRDAYLVNLILFAFFCGGVFCSALDNATHETVHDRAFGMNYPLANKALALFINLALAWPSVGGYDKTHRHHHAYLGTDLDAKYPTMSEALEYDHSVAARLKFVFLHPILGDKRWAKHNKSQSEASVYEVVNFYLCWAFNLVFAVIVGWKSTLYLLVAFWANNCIWIQGSKNFQDHWVDEEVAHVMSYYGPFNYVNFNVGYHREHHDFPTISGRYLRQVNKIAHEYYADKSHYRTSLFAAFWEMLIAPPGKGITKHANKLNVVMVEKLE